MTPEQITPENIALENKVPIVPQRKHVSKAEFSIMQR
jgi:hypothetical protein